MNFCFSCGYEIVGDAHYCMNCGQKLKEGSVTTTNTNHNTQIISSEGLNTETNVSKTHPSPNTIKNPHVIWLIFGILSNISLVIVLLLIDATIANLGSGYGLIYGESPIGKLKIAVVILSIITLGLHFLRPNLTSWIMMPILFFMSYKFYRMLNPLSSDISQAKQSGFLGFEGDISADAFSSFEGLQIYPLLGGLFYIAIIVIKLNLIKKHKRNES